jgi:hypothetical protein
MIGRRFNDSSLMLRGNSMIFGVGVCNTPVTRRWRGDDQRLTMAAMAGVECIVFFDFEDFAS